MFHKIYFDILFPDYWVEEFISIKKKGCPYLERMVY